jgi:hypothetical protein
MVYFVDFYPAHSGDINCVYVQIHPIFSFEQQLVIYQNSREDPNTQQVTPYHGDWTKLCQELERLFATLHSHKGQLNNP